MKYNYVFDSHQQVINPHNVKESDSQMISRRLNKLRPLLLKDIQLLEAFVQFCQKTDDDLAVKAVRTYNAKREICVKKDDKSNPIKNGDWSSSRFRFKYLYETKNVDVIHLFYSILSSLQ